MPDGTSVWGCGHIKKACAAAAGQTGDMCVLSCVYPCVLCQQLSVEGYSNLGFGKREASKNKTPLPATMYI